MRHKRFTPFGAVAIAVVLSAWSTSRAAAQDLYAALGSSLYSDDPFCLSTGAALSTAQIGVGGYCPASPHDLIDPSRWYTDGAGERILAEAQRLHEFVQQDFAGSDG